MSIILVEGVRYRLWTPEIEKELHNIVKEHSKDILGEQTVYFDVSMKFKSIAGLGSRPDGCFIDLERKDWGIVEIELSKHDPYDHINNQLTRFINGIENPRTRNYVVDTLYDEINDQKSLHVYFEAKIDTDIHRWLSKVISQIPKIVVVIEEKTGEVIEACRILERNYETHILELKTYKEEKNQNIHAHQPSTLQNNPEQTSEETREDAKNVHIHLLEPLYVSGATSPPMRITEVTKRPMNGNVKREPDEWSEKRHEFWNQLLIESNKQMDLFSRIKPSKRPYIWTNAGISGIFYQYQILEHWAGVALILESKDTQLNKRRFDELKKNKQRIEKDFEGELTWERNDNANQSHINAIVENKGLKDMNDWPIIIGKMVNAMVRFQTAFKSALKTCD